MTNPSASIANFVANTQFDDLPASTRRAAGRAVTDAVGVMAAASGCSDEVRPFLDLASGSGGHGRCTILGTGQRVSAPMAALANGAMAHALDFEDVFDAAPCHPNASAVPAALAMAQQLGSVDGRQFITAIAVGCELVCRAALSVGDALARRGWYPPPLLGSLGAAAAVAKLLDGGPERVLDTLSLTLMHATAPAEIGHSRQTTLRATREAFPASAAVSAGLLASAGSRGFEDPLFGEAGFFALYAGGECDERALLEGLGTRFYTDNLSFKRWPTCRGTHAAVQIALDLVNRQGVRWQDIDSVAIVVSELQRMLAEPAERKQAPATLIDARFSLPFSTAVALVRGRVSLGEFRADVLDDTDILSLARKVSVRVREDWGTDHAAACSMRLVLSTGDVLERTVEQPLGSVGTPLGDADLVDKFVDCTSRAARRPSRATALDVARRLLALDAGADVGLLVTRLFPEVP